MRFLFLYSILNNFLYEGVTSLRHKIWINESIKTLLDTALTHRYFQQMIY